MRIYEIKNGNLRVKLSTHGGTFTSIQKDGLEYLWQGTAAPCHCCDKSFRLSREYAPEKPLPVFCGKEEETRKRYP